MKQSCWLPSAALCGALATAVGCAGTAGQRCSEPTAATRSAPAEADGAGEFTPADAEAIGAVIQDQAAAWNRGDLAGFMEGYWRSPDLVFTSGAQVRRGWQTTMDRFDARYGQSTDGMGTLTFEVLEVRSVGARGAVVLGKYVLTDTENANRGVFSLVLERRPEGWRIVHDHTSAEPGPVAPANAGEPADGTPSGQAQ